MTTTMTKRIKLIYTLLLAVALPLLTACSSDDTGNDGGLNKKGEKITVRFRVAQAGSNTMRAWKDTSEDVEEKEMMNIWTVIAVENESNKVVGIWSCKPKNTDEKEIDEVGEFTVSGLFTQGGNYRVYSFANMGAAYLGTLLGLSDNVIPEPNADGNVEANTDATSLNGCTLAEQQVKEIVVLVKGNGFDQFGSGAANDFGSYGIPMSNVQTFTNLQAGEKNLVVIRMLAKIKLQLYNDSDDDITINSITLTNLTANEKEGDANYKNIKLLPNLTKGQDTMESTNDYHADIQPNLNGTPPQAEYIYKPANEKKTISKTDNTSGSKTPVEYIFYVNESENPQGDYYGPSDTKPLNPQRFMRYFLKINLQSGTRTSEVRYTLIDTNKLDDINDKWNYIARNDYRIIPIVLDDYKFEIVPYDFPAIGVLPASVKEEDGIYTINFHDYGHFHLVPKVTRYSTDEVVSYSKESNGNGDTYWNLGVDNESTQLLSGALTTSGVWGSWLDASKNYVYVNANAGSYDGFNGIPFYGTDNNSLVDGDDAGGEPLWYVNDNPEWDEYAGPFIFGYIADPNPENNENYESVDRKVYHEFTINLHKKGSDAVRPMTYRLYMILDADQMLYRKNGAPRVCHPHCLH